MVVRYNYNAWGMLFSITGSLASTIGAVNPLRYRGYYYDTETSLYYLQSRYYDPETCRFISADAYIVAGNYLTGTNMFAYCMNNPVMYSDPSGYKASYESKVVTALLMCCFCTSYIAEYAIQNGQNIDSFVDYLGRINSEENNIFGLQIAWLLAVKYYLTQVGL